MHETLDSLTFHFAFATGCAQVGAHHWDVSGFSDLSFRLCDAAGPSDRIEAAASGFSDLSFRLCDVDFRVGWPIMVVLSGFSDLSFRLCDGSSLNPFGGRDLRRPFRAVPFRRPFRRLLIAVAIT